MYDSQHCLRGFDPHLQFRRSWREFIYVMMAGVAESGPCVSDRVSQLFILHVRGKANELDAQRHVLDARKVLLPEVLQSYFEGLPTQVSRRTWPNTL